MMAQKFGRYEVKRPLGHGGMAVVYLAYDPAMKREVAVKVLPSHLTADPQFINRFRHEVEIVAKLEHPCIVPVYDYGEEENQPYIVMRCMTGGSFLNRLTKGPLDLFQLVPIINRVARALDKAHSQGIIHRDLKPGNILFDDQDQAYLSDFGIAKVVESTSSHTGSAIIGTAAYMSPEQGSGSKNLDGRSDIYALGIIVFEALTGQLPYQADTPIVLLMKHIQAELPRLREVKPDLPPSCEIVIQQAMAKTPESRYPTAGALATDLSTVASGGIIQPDPELQKHITEPVTELSDLKEQPELLPTRSDISAPASLEKARKQRWPLLLGGLGLLVIGAVATAIFGGGGPTTSTPESTATVIIAANLTTTPTETPISTLTSLLTDTPTSLPTNTPTPRPSMAGVIKSGPAQLHSGPGKGYSSIGVLEGDTNLALLGRNAQGDWLKVKSVSGEEGWVRTDQIEAFMAILDIPVVAESTPTSTVALTVSNTPSPTPTDTPIPPTATPTNEQVSAVVPVSCTNEPQGEFRRLWEKHRGQLGCPHQISPIGGFYAEQPFQNGHMFWSKDGRIYLATIGKDSGKWQLFPEDASPWKEGMPQLSCEVQVPPGLVQPVRGFGGLWCANADLREQIGWGLDVERGFEDGIDLIQGFGGGIIFRDSDGHAQGIAYVLFSDDMTFIREAY
jgi:serine/threonine-protein kinase